MRKTRRRRRGLARETEKLGAAGIEEKYNSGNKEVASAPKVYLNIVCCL